MSTIVIAALFSVFSVSAWAHGVRGYTEKAEGICLVAQYDDGEPMSYADVTITSANSKIPFQTGRTDRNGRFFFQPDEPGQWHITVKDGMGHLVNLGLEMTGDGVLQKNTESRPQVSSLKPARTQKIITGLSVIFGIFGILYAWKARRTII
jgi:nickel transport protein